MDTIEDAKKATDEAVSADGDKPAADAVAADGDTPAADATSADGDKPAGDTASADAREEARALSEAEMELVGVYSEQIAQFYAHDRLKECDRLADKVLRYLPGDVYALFIKGAVRGRLSKPADLHIDEAFAIWKPVVASCGDDERGDLLAAIGAAFGIMSLTPVEYGIRAWDAYHDVRTAHELQHVLDYLRELPGRVVDDPVRDAWIQPMVDRNCGVWVNKVIGVDIQIPMGEGSPAIDAFYDMIHSLDEVAASIPAGEEARAVSKRSVHVLERFEKLNGSDMHPERREYLASRRASIDAAASDRS